MKNSRRSTLSTPVALSNWWAAFQQREIAGQRVAVPILLGIVVALALVLRLTGVNWDSDGRVSGHQNPDERHMANVATTIRFPSSPAQYFDTDESPLNPYNSFPSYPWGTLPLFGTKAVAELMDEAPLGGPSGGGTWSNYDHIHLVGRVLSSLVDVGSIIVTFLLGSYLFNRRVGLLAAFLLAVTVLNIQYAHYFVVDSFLAFFSLVSIYFAVRAAREGGRLNFALAGVMFGAALASKGSAAALAPIIAMAAAIQAWPVVKRQWAESRGSITAVGLWSGGLKEPVLGLGLAAVLAFAVFRVFQPYAFDGPFPWDINNIWRTDVQAVYDRGTGEGSWPPAVRWIGEVRWLYPLHNMMVWGMGIPLFLAAAGGVLYATWRLLRRGELILLLLLTWIAVIFLWQGGLFISYMRYLLPIYSILVLLAAYGLVQLWQAKEWTSVPKRLEGFRAPVTRYAPALARASVG
ncbi:MAG TPA: glycosyltransferase family 39 protein, partial [Dehalococcoidia bacterium]|nr:glycosyltransferase family 39 protein [Dehalococcoidia bacterium]